MDLRWWSLPGPRSFRDRVLSDLRDGKNVVVRLPEGTPDMRRFLEEGVLRYDSLRFRHVDASEIHGVIPLALFSTLRCSRGIDELQTAATLAANLPDGDVVFVNGIDADAWPAWAAFATQYQHGCNARPEHRRAMFCFAVSGPLNEEPKDDATLSVRECRECFSRLDAMLLIDQLLPGDRSNRTLRQVAVSVAAELAGTDADLALALARAGTDLVQDPIRIVSDVAARMSWRNADLTIDRRCCGWSESYDGVQRVRSTAASLRNDLATLRRRVWHGQIRILYPFIEEQRLRHIDRVSDWLTLPVQTTFGVVEHAIDLEIGPMVYVLRNTRLPKPTWDSLVLLNDLRRDLAHLSPVNPALLKSAPFVGMCRDAEQH